MLGLILLLQTLVVAVASTPGSLEHLPLHVAEAAGHFTAEGLAVTLRSVRSDVAAAEALASGEVDLAVMPLEAAVRFGLRPKATPQIVFGLTAAPPVALLATTAREAPTTVAGLRDLRVAASSPGAPELAWLHALLDRARLRPADVRVVSFGTRGAAGAVDRGEVQVGLVSEPYAADLVDRGRATVIVDLRTPEAVRRALDRPTVDTAVFARRQHRPDDPSLAAFARALVAAETELAAAGAGGLATPLPEVVTGAAEAWGRRLQAAQHLYLAGGQVTPEQVAASLELIKARFPLSPTIKLPPPRDWVHLAPLTPPAPAARR
jgi:ABC-type nitrate/sulfonate/bicarbonate transport system substrate-binding protein